MSFPEALALTLRFEGGYVNDPADAGGETNLGVTKRVWLAWCEARHLPAKAMKDLTPEDVAPLYEQLYWDLGNCESLPDKIAVAHFDCCVNAGVRRAAKILQQAVGVPDDGLIGHQTLSAIAAADEGMLLKALLDDRRAFYAAIATEDPPKLKFLHGWLRRVDQLEEALA